MKLIEASDIDMVFNASKSMLLRVGSRYNRSCAHVGIGSNVIPTRQNILVSLFVPQRSSSSAMTSLSFERAVYIKVFGV